MAPYVHESEVQTILARDLARLGGNAASINEAEIRENIARAEAEVNGRLATSYTTPFVEPVPEMIKDITSSIACYLSVLTYRENRDFQTEMNPVLLRYQRASELLTGLATGSIQIPPEGTTPDVGIGTRIVSSVNRPRLFSDTDFDIHYPGVARGEPDFTNPESWAIHE